MNYVTRPARGSGGGGAGAAAAAIKGFVVNLAAISPGNSSNLSSRVRRRHFLPLCSRWATDRARPPSPCRPTSEGGGGAPHRRHRVRPHNALPFLFRRSPVGLCRSAAFLPVGTNFSHPVNRHKVKRNTGTDASKDVLSSLRLSLARIVAIRRLAKTVFYV